MKKSITLDIFDENGASLGKKRFYTTLDSKESINKWIKQYDDKKNFIALVVSTAPDFQHNQQLAILSKQQERYCFYVSLATLIPFSVYFSVRHCIPHTWINHNDQFLNPNKKWEKDTEFHSDCLIFMLFHGKNRITNKEGINHFIQDFLQGKIKLDSKNTNSKSLFNDELESSFIPTKPLEFSDEAKEVLQAGKELFKHYHEQTRDSKDYNPNAALYDIKAHFQGFNDKGKGKDRMNPPQKAKDEAYKQKLGELNYALKNLAKRIESKVYEYEFLLS